MGLNQAKSEIFRHFLGFGLYFFLKPAHNDSLLQCLASSRNKTQEKKLAAQILAKQAKIRPEITFSPFSQVWSIIFTLSCIG